MTITVDATAAPATSENPQVTIFDNGSNRMFAFNARTGAVLAEAHRRGEHHDDEWIGWAVFAPCRKTEVVMTRLLARHILTEYALDAVGGVR